MKQVIYIGIVLISFAAGIATRQSIKTPIRQVAPLPRGPRGTSDHQRLLAAEFTIRQETTRLCILDQKVYCEYLKSMK